MNFGWKTFINTTDELHAFLIGFCETLCPWKPRYSIHEESEYKPFREYHYYLAGRVVGFIILLLILIGLAKLAEEVLI